MSVAILSYAKATFNPFLSTGVELRGREPLACQAGTCQLGDSWDLFTLILVLDNFV